MKEHYHKHKVNQVDIKNVQNIDDYLKELRNSNVFEGGHLAKAVDILEKAKREKAGIFVGMAGAMIPGGMRKVICQAMKDGFITCLTTTGANITHDIIEAIGGGHIHSVNYESDVDLLEKGIDRVYDSFVKKGSFELFEIFIKEILEQLISDDKNTGKQIKISPSELMKIIGEKLEDEDSIVRTAYKYNIPIFIPAISDSVLGLQLWLFSQFNDLTIDTITDLGKIQDIYHETNNNCALLLGGGVPKNYTLQSALMASKNYKYAVQITLDRVETGGLSGAPLNEAISWGKLEPDAEHISVISDLTIVLPLIFNGLRKRFGIE